MTAAVSFGATAGVMALPPRPAAAASYPSATATTAAPRATTTTTSSPATTTTTVISSAPSAPVTASAVPVAHHSPWARIFGLAALLIALVLYSEGFGVLGGRIRSLSSRAVRSRSGPRG
ncbi:MAG: hypothetical protein ACYCSJ_00790 [Acidimicrobiales bacterium]